MTTRLPHAPRSKIVPFIPGEDPERRHERRLDTALDTALDMVTEAKRGLDPLGLELHVSPDGRHWSVIDRGLRLAEWWPKTARFVALGRDGSPMKFHDVLGFLRGVRLAMGLRRVVPAPMVRQPQAPQVRMPLAVELDGEGLGWIIRRGEGWIALCLDKRPLTGVEHRGRHWAISEVCAAAMPTGFGLVDLGGGSHTYCWGVGDPLDGKETKVYDAPQDAVRAAREHAAELARRRSPAAVLARLAGSSR